MWAQVCGRCGGQERIVWLLRVDWIICLDRRVRQGHRKRLLMWVDDSNIMFLFLSTHVTCRNQNPLSLWLMWHCLRWRLQRLPRHWQKPRRLERRGEQKKGKKILCAWGESNRFTSVHQSAYIIPYSLFNFAELCSTCPLWLGSCSSKAFTGNGVGRIRRTTTTVLDFIGFPTWRLFTLVSTNFLNLAWTWFFFDVAQDQPPAPPPTLDEIDVTRHREITSKAVSAILLLILKWFKVSREWFMVSSCIFLFSPRCYEISPFGPTAVGHQLLTVDFKNVWTSRSISFCCI